MIRQCHLCGNCGENYPLTPLGFECGACKDQRDLFDADELGLDPETDNDPKHRGRLIE